MFDFLSLRQRFSRLVLYGIFAALAIAALLLLVRFGFYAWVYLTVEEWATVRLGLDYYAAQLAATSVVIAFGALLPTLIWYLVCGRRRALGAATLIGAKALICLLVYTVGSTVCFDRRTGRPLCYYADTPQGRVWSRTPGFEPRTGLPFQLYTREAQAGEEAERRRAAEERSQREATEMHQRQIEQRQREEEEARRAAHELRERELREREEERTRRGQELERQRQQLAHQREQEEAAERQRREEESARQLEVERKQGGAETPRLPAGPDAQSAADERAVEERQSGEAERQRAEEIQRRREADARQQEEGAGRQREAAQQRRREARERAIMTIAERVVARLPRRRY